LLDCADQLGERQYGREVEQRARRARDGYVLVLRHVLGVEPPHSMDPEPARIRPSRRGHVDRRARAAAQIEESSGRLVAEHCARSARENAGQPPPVGAERPVPDGVDAQMEPMKATTCHPPVNRGLTDAERDQLPLGDHPVLPGCDLRHCQ
jgi:hypothetical protein